MTCIKLKLAEDMPKQNVHKIASNVEYVYLTDKRVSKLLDKK